MKTRNILYFLLILVCIVSCKKDSATTVTGNEKVKTEATSIAPPKTVTTPKVEDNSSNTHSGQLDSPLAGTSWYAFINAREPGDIHNYFLLYAEYNFQESTVEFFANMINASRTMNYAMRGEQVYFTMNGKEELQFQILERTETSIKIRTATGKINTLLKTPDIALLLSRKERIRAALIRQGFNVDEINERFKAIDTVQIN